MANTNKKEPISSHDLKRKFLETVYAATKDPKLVTACNFDFDKAAGAK